MQLSLQKKTNLQHLYHIRKTVIKEFSLHIDDRITYPEFKEIYTKYGAGYDEPTFAKYVLDISTNRFYKYSVGKTKETPILTKEFVSNEEIEQIRQKVLEAVKDNKDKKIHYAQLMELYQKYGDRLSLTTFAEEMLNITPHSVDCLKSYDPSVTILKGVPYDKELVLKARDEIVKKANLHIDDEIDFAQFRKLYDKYGKGLDEKVFATKCLDISASQVNRFLKDEGAKAVVFSNYIVNPEDIFALREKVIKREKFHIDDAISNEQFLELYKKYGGMLTRDMFAEEILDITAVGVKNMRVQGTNSLVLGDIDVPKEYVDELKRNIAKTEKLAEGQLIKKSEFLDLYKKYAGILSQKQFALDVLKMSPNSYSPLMLEINERAYILVGEQITDFEALRKKVIKENFLHYDDKMDYYRFIEIRNKYGPNIPEYIFADKILDINASAFANISFDKGRIRTFILSREKIPNEEEMQILRRKVLFTTGLHIKDKINYAKVQELHREFGGIIPEYMFAREILGIRKNELSEMSRNPDKEICILPATKVPIKELKSLRHKVLKDNNIESKNPISLDEFNKLYVSYKHFLTPRMFARGVLGIHGQNLDKLRNGTYHTVKALQDKTNLENLPWVTLKDPLEKFNLQKDLTKRVKKIIEDFAYTPKNVGKVAQYLQMCADESKSRKFDKKELLFLDECVEFIQGGEKEIGNFVKIAIANQQYEIAAKCIAKNLHNDSVNREARIRLMEMRSKLLISIQKERAISLLSENKDVEEIANTTGMPVIKIIALKKKLFASPKLKNYESNSSQESR